MCYRLLRRLALLHISWCMILVLLAIVTIPACNRSESTSRQLTEHKPTKIKSPEINIPTIKSPEINIPEINIPETNPLEINPPEINIPEITLPEISHPNIRVQQEDNLTIITIASDVLFDFDKDTIRPDAEIALRQVQDVIAKRYPDKTLQIQGHTDAIGSEAYNQNLSERRAMAVHQWFRQEGNISASRMTTRGYGESQPIASNIQSDGSDNPEGRQQNRRVEILIQ
jgi:outer membrane protein OmpA-like peptidoglycan-associated protein